MPEGQSHRGALRRSVLAIDRTKGMIAEGLVVTASRDEEIQATRRSLDARGAMTEGGSVTFPPGHVPAGGMILEGLDARGAIA
jgi:hypothetical protein